MVSDFLVSLTRKREKKSVIFEEIARPAQYVIISIVVYSAVKNKFAPFLIP